MKHCKAIFFLLSVLLLFGCEKDFPLSEEAATPKITINCAFSPVEYFRVYVSRSLAFNELSRQTVLTDATVELFENGISLGNMFFLPTDTVGTFGYYTLNGFLPTEGKNYKVKVSHPLYGVAYAGDIIPQPATVTASLVSFTDSFYSQHSTVSLNIQHDAATPAFFRAQAFYIITYTYFDSVLNQPVTATQYLPATIREIQGVADTLPELGIWYLFSSAGFDAVGSADIQLNIESGFGYISIASLDLYIDVQRLSDAGYHYATTLQYQRNSDDNGSHEPVTVFSNVQNGYGIFSGYNLSRSVIPVR